MNTCVHFFACSNYIPQQNILFDKVNEIIPKFRQFSHRQKCTILLYGFNINAKEFDCRNIPIIYAVQAYITSTKRFLQAKISSGLLPSKTNKLIFITKITHQKPIYFYYQSHLSWRESKLFFSCNILTFKIIFFLCSILIENKLINIYNIRATSPLVS